MEHKFFQLTNKSFELYGAKTYEELWTKAKAEGYTAIQCGFVTVFTKAEDADNKFHAVLSDALEDRHGDIVKQEWVLTHFKRNPVLLDSHNYGSIEMIIGKWVKIAVTDGKLQGDIEFALMNPRGVLAKDMAEGGFLCALSAGFIPLEFDDKGTILKSELLEGSMVSVPANPRTLLEKGIEEDDTTTKSEDDETGDGDIESPGTPEPIQKVAQKSIVVLMQEELDKQKSIITAVATELKRTDSGNIGEGKRKMWKELRKAIN